MRKVLLCGTLDDLEKQPDILRLVEEEYSTRVGYSDEPDSRCGFEVEKRAERLAQIHQACAASHPLTVIHRLMNTQLRDEDVFGNVASRLWEDIFAVLHHLSTSKKLPRTQRITAAQLKYFMYHLICENHESIAQLCNVSASAVSQALRATTAKLDNYILRQSDEECSACKCLCDVVTNGGWDLVREALRDCLTDDWDKDISGDILPKPAG